jgi:isopenicillin N synthase-like dioxygenase
MQPLTSHHLLPPFPNNVKTAPLVSVKFEVLQKGDREASATVFNACKELGFFYLDLFGSELGENIVAEAEKLNKFQQQFFDLPNAVKDVYGRPHLHPFYAYRFNELAIKDEKGVPLRTESYNVSSSRLFVFRSGGQAIAAILMPSRPTSFIVELNSIQADSDLTAAQRRHPRQLRTPRLPPNDVRATRAVRQLHKTLPRTRRLLTRAPKHAP